MKHTITSYSQLMESITNLIESSNGEIRIVSYFILPGYWQVKNNSIKGAFAKALEDAKDRINIVCLEPKEHLSIVIDLAKKGTPSYPVGKADGSKIIAFQEQCENILLNFHAFPPKRLNWNKLPYYYFYVTRERAIIVTPVGLPKINRNIVTMLAEISDENHINYILSTLSNSSIENGKVDTLGFETSDHNIIEMLWSKFDGYSRENGVDVEIPPSGEPQPNGSTPPPNAEGQGEENDNVNIAVCKTTNAMDVLVEVFDKIKVKVNVQR
jgi:hypothetical protein